MLTFHRLLQEVWSAMSQSILPLLPYPLIIHYYLVGLLFLIKSWSSSSVIVAHNVYLSSSNIYYMETVLKSCPQLKVRLFRALSLTVELLLSLDTRKIESCKQHFHLLAKVHGCRMKVQACIELSLVERESSGVKAAFPCFTEPA